VLIDLLLFLRTHSAPSANQADTSATTHPIALSLVELLFNVLVDCPDNARAFERLGGLEAISRVMRGSNVEKVVK
jgi:hypothetical protein